MSVLLIGTLDTKGVEFAYVRDRLRAAGSRSRSWMRVCWVRPRSSRTFHARPSSRRPATTYDAIKAAGDRGQAVAQAARGVAKIAADLHRQGKA